MQVSTEAGDQSEEAARLRAALAQEQRRCRELVAQLAAQVADSRSAHEAVMVCIELASPLPNHLVI